MTTITALPTPPTRQDPTNFAARGDAFMAALPAFATQANAVASEVNANTAICQSAAMVVGVVAWVSGTTYAIGAAVYDTTDFLTYRRKTAGAGTTRPGLDGTNWALLTGFGDATLAGNQTFTGVKTFSQTIVGNISGNAATAGSAATAGTAGTCTGNAATADSALVAAACTGNAATASTVASVSTAQVLNATAGAGTGGVGTYAFCRGAMFTPGSTHSGASLHYTGGVVESVAQSVGSGTWRSMGYVSATDRGTLLLRIA